MGWNSGPSEAPGSLDNHLEGRQDFTTDSSGKLTCPQRALPGHLQPLLNCHLMGSWGMQENRWEKFRIQMHWSLKQSLCLSGHGSPSVWVTHPGVGVRHLFLKKHISFCRKKSPSLPSHLFWKCLIWNELTLKGVPSTVRACFVIIV